MKSRKPGHIGIDIGEWLGLLPILGSLVHDAAAVKALPRGPERSAAIRSLVLSKVEALAAWLDNALED